VVPEYWNTGVAVLLFAEMVERAVVQGYEWLDLSLTGEDNPDVWDLAHGMGARIYKRYRFFKKQISPSWRRTPDPCKTKPEAVSLRFGQR